MSEKRLRPATYGIETEYSALLTAPGSVEYEIVGECHSADAKIGLYQTPQKKGSDVIRPDSISAALRSMGIIRNPGQMLSNGGRLYIDPSGPEYATPETTTAQDAVLRSFEGDEIMLGVLKYLKDAEVIENYQLNRRVVDHNRASRGVHLNTSTYIEDTSPTSQMAHLLATLNVAKGALFGSGGLLLDEHGQTAYHHSPRLSLTDAITAPYSQWRARPLVRLPFKYDVGGLSRIETVTSDALSFGWPLRASLVMTNALVTMIETGFGNRLPILQTARAIASAENVGEYGYDGHMVVEFSSGQVVMQSSLDVLMAIAEITLKTDSKNDILDTESRQVLHEVIEVGDVVSEDPESAAFHVESIARFLSMKRKMEATGTTLDSERICRFDYAWDWLGGGGTAETLKGRGMSRWYGFDTLPTRRQKAERLITPPQDTRAKVRGDFITAQNGADKSTWTTLVSSSEYCVMAPTCRETPPKNKWIQSDKYENEE